MAIRPNHYLYIPLETILQKVPIEIRERMNRRQISEDAQHSSPTEKSLIRLHRQVNCLSRKKEIVILILGL